VPGLAPAAVYIRVNRHLRAVDSPTIAPTSGLDIAARYNVYSPSDAEPDAAALDTVVVDTANTLNANPAFGSESAGAFTTVSPAHMLAAVLHGGWEQIGRVSRHHSHAIKQNTHPRPRRSDATSLGNPRNSVAYHIARG
jgi:hypothetical protein